MMIYKRALFGPAGNAASFSEMGYKSSLDVPEYLEKMELDWFEYQCGRGVNIGLEKAKLLGEKMSEKNKGISLHAPYYISLASKEPEKRENSIKYIIQSAEAVNAMGGNRIVVHSGGLGGLSREAACELACKTLKKAQNVLDEYGLSNIHICPETMGKINQLGNLDEILEMCLVDERFIPCIDFGHLNARTHGGLKTIEDFKNVFDKIEDKLGLDRLKVYHSHFSKIEYSDGGEKRHLTFADEKYGPDFDFVAELTCRKGCTPVIVCESAGTQAEDAKTMKDMYLELV